MSKMDEPDFSPSFAMTITPEMQAVADAIGEHMSGAERAYGEHIDAARAALLAIRKPTEAMVKAMNANFDTDYPDLASSHTDMIDYILGGAP